MYLGSVCHIPTAHNVWQILQNLEAPNKLHKKLNFLKGMEISVCMEETQSILPHQRKADKTWLSGTLILGQP